MSKLDKLDRKILSTLQVECKISLQELAEKAGLSSATCWRRLRSMEAAGMIEGYSAILNQQKMGYNICAFVHVSIEKPYAEIVSELENQLVSRPEVMECYATAGDSDFILRVIATDIADYDQFLHKFLFKLPGVGQVRSSIALRQLKQSTVLPL